MSEINTAMNEDSDILPCRNHLILIQNAVSFRRWIIPISLWKCVDPRFVPAWRGFRSNSRSIRMFAAFGSRQRHMWHTYWMLSTHLKVALRYRLEVVIGWKIYFWNNIAQPLCRSLCGNHPCSYNLQNAKYRIVGGPPVIPSLRVIYDQGLASLKGLEKEATNNVPCCNLYYTAVDGKVVTTNRVI